MNGYRKFLIVALALGLSFWLALDGKLTVEFEKIVNICILSYCGAHAIADYVNGRAAVKPQ